MRACVRACVRVTLTHPGGSVEWAGCDSAVEGRPPPLKQKPVRMTVGRPDGLIEGLLGFPYSEAEAGRSERSLW